MKKYLSLLFVSALSLSACLRNDTTYIESLRTGKTESIQVPLYVQNLCESDKTVTVEKGKTTLGSIKCRIIDARSKQEVTYLSHIPLNDETFTLIRFGVCCLMKKDK